MKPLPKEQLAMWLSIKPKYAEQILTGIKTVELRKQIPKLEPGSLVFLYASSPKKALVGAFLLEHVEIEKPGDLWSKVEKKSCLDFKYYREYYFTSDKAVGLYIGTLWKIKNPVKLDDIRKDWPTFSPPQSFRYVEWSKDKKSKMLLHFSNRTIGPFCFA